ncbi:MAG: hypothetical protein QM758_18135 [Armatimonas sp.]
MPSWIRPAGAVRSATGRSEGAGLTSTPGRPGCGGANLTVFCAVRGLPGVVLHHADLRPRDISDFSGKRASPCSGSGYLNRARGRGIRERDSGIERAI